MEVLTALEFFSGIGGLHLAAQRSSQALSRHLCCRCLRSLKHQDRSDSKSGLNLPSRSEHDAADANHNRELHQTLAAGQAVNYCQGRNDDNEADNAGKSFSTELAGSAVNCECSTPSEASVNVISAYDVNDHANRTYAYNFVGCDASPSSPEVISQAQDTSKLTKAKIKRLKSKAARRVQTRDLCRLTLAEIDGKADLWLLSPPCQPYTRGGSQKGSNDLRAAPFHHLISLLGDSSQPPEALFIENVRGFETSDSHASLVSALEAQNYDFQEFFLSPTQFGIPNSRVRYYCSAVRRCEAKTSQNSRVESSSDKEIAQPTLSDISRSETAAINKRTQPDVPGSPPASKRRNVEKVSSASEDESPQSELPVLAQGKPASDADSPAPLSKSAVLTEPPLAIKVRPPFSEAMSGWTMRTFADYLDKTLDNAPGDLEIEKAAVLKNVSFKFDVVTPASWCSTTITKGYGRLVGKSGPVVAIGSAALIIHDDAVPIEADPQIHVEKTQTICAERFRLLDPKTDRIRWLSNQELLRLAGFPASFAFPPELTRQQCYGLIGNSVNVDVIAVVLLNLLLRVLQQRKGVGNAISTMPCGVASKLVRSLQIQ